MPLSPRGSTDASACPRRVTLHGVGATRHTGVLLHSAAFWLGQIEHLARMAWEFLLTFSLYPPVLFRGGLRRLLFTLVPAGFIGYLPALLRAVYFAPGSPTNTNRPLGAAPHVR